MNGMNEFKIAVKEVITSNDNELYSKDGETRFIAEECKEQWDNEVDSMLDWSSVKQLPTLAEVMFEKYIAIFQVASSVLEVKKMSAKVEELIVQDFAKLLWEVGTGQRLEAISEDADWSI